MDANMGGVARGTLDLVLSEPVIGAVLVENTAAMGIDGHAMVVRPDFSGMKAVLCLRKSAVRWDECERTEGQKAK